jgi:hypothetical protein
VARTGFFGRHSTDSTAEADAQMAERDQRIAETAPTARERAAATGRAAVEEHRAEAERDVADQQRRAGRDGTVYRADATDADTRVRYPAVTAPREDREPTTERAAEPATEPVTTEPAPYVRAHTSVLATIALVVGVIATCAAFTGRLAPVAVAVGALGALLSIGGLSSASRRGVTGHGVALLALLFSVGGIAFGIMAINHTVPWLSTGTDQAGQIRDWLNAQLPWLKRW